MADSLGPSDQSAQRKQSNVSSNQGADARKQSNVSNGSASRRLSALFGPGTSEVEKVKPRKRYTKEDLLNKFKPTV